QPPRTTLFPYTTLFRSSKIPNQVRKVLEQSEKIRQVTEMYTNRENWLFLGRGYNYPVALEGALKLKEISYIHAEGLPAAEMKHGDRKSTRLNSSHSQIS